jgi:hypothetical protein
MWELCASSVLIVSKAVGDPKKKANSQKSGVKKSKKRNIIVHRGWHVGPMSQQRPQFQRRHRIERKRQVTKNQGVKNPRKKLYCT